MWSVLFSSETAPLTLEADFQEWTSLATISDSNERSKRFANALMLRRGQKAYLLKTLMVGISICTTVVFCVSRMYALQSNYGGYLHLWTNVGIATMQPRQVSPLSPQKLCVGSEWYRFASHFHLPDTLTLAFVKDTFGGQLPQYYAPIPQNRSVSVGTAMPRTAFNGLNAEEPSRYVDLSECAYVVISVDPDYLATSENENELQVAMRSPSPMFRAMNLRPAEESDRHKNGENRQRYRPLLRYPVIEPRKSSSTIARAFYVPSLSPRSNHMVQYTLYQKVTA